MKVRVVISGCLGRMGRRVAHFAFQEPEIEVVAGLEAFSHPDIGKDLGQALGEGVRNTKIFGQPEEAITLADVVVEFTNPQATLEHIKLVTKLNKKIVIGTTGFDHGQIKQIEDSSQKIPILISPNMSIGVNVIFKVLPLLTKLLAWDYDIEIVELHHNKKKDAPSGTAKKIAQIIKDIRKELKFIYGREGSTCLRDKSELGIHALRLGDIVGEHKIIFAGNDERIELTHSAGSRDIFARGAILAIKYLKDKKYGLYTMEDVLSERLK